MNRHKNTGKCLDRNVGLTFALVRSYKLEPCDCGRKNELRPQSGWLALLAGFAISVEVARLRFRLTFDRDIAGSAFVLHPAWLDTKLVDVDR